MEHSFNRTAAAAQLGLSLRQIRYRIARLNIATPAGTTTLMIWSEQTPCGEMAGTDWPASLFHSNLDHTQACRLTCCRAFHFRPDILAWACAATVHQPAGLGCTPIFQSIKFAGLCAFHRIPERAELWQFVSVDDGHGTRASPPTGAETTAMTTLR
jgi:hypothetical protein